MARLLDPEMTVWAVGRGPRSPGGGARWIDADLSTRDFAAALPPRADLVLHFAQSNHYQAFPGQALDVFHVNVGSTAVLLDWARQAGVRRFVYASSGDLGADPSSYYLATKRSSELLASHYRPHFAVTLLRFYFVYGAGQRRTMLIPRLVDQIRAGRPVMLAGQDGLRLNPVHVSDAATAAVAAARADLNLTIDVAGPEVLSLRSIATIIGEQLGVAPRFTQQPGPEPELIGDITAMTRHLGAPQRRFASAVRDVIEQPS